MNQNELFFVVKQPRYDILKKRYHILRYEHFLKSNKTNEKKLNQLLDDYREINRQLTDTCEKEKKSELYKDMICLIKEIADHVIPKENVARKGMDDIMGGKVLTLPSDLIRQGREEGRNETIFSYAQNGIISLEQGAKDTNMSVEQFEEAMTKAGYKLPAQI